MEWFKNVFENQLSLYDLTPQAVFFGLTEKHLDSILLNHLLLVFKIYFYKSHSFGFFCLKSLLLEIKMINCLEKKIAKANANKHKSHLCKWNKIDKQLIIYLFIFALVRFYVDFIFLTCNYLKTK